MRTYNEQFVTNQVMNVSSNSQPMELIQIFGYAIQARFVGSSITGTLKLQVSCDPNNNPGASGPNPTHWTDLAGSPQAISAAGDFMWNVSDPAYNWVRLVYTDGSGGTSNGHLTAVLNAKGF